MAEIKTLEEAKAKIGQVVKCCDNSQVENLKGIDVLSGTVVKILSSWEHTKDGDKCLSFTTNVDVVDPVDGGVHHLTSEKVFIADTKDDDVKNVTVNEEVAKLQARIIELEASKVVVVDTKLISEVK